MYGSEGKKYAPYTVLDDNKEKMEFKILVNDKLEPWSVCFNIPAGVIRDGLSCNYLLIDEPQFVNSQKGSLLENFGSSSNPVKTLTGIQTASSDNMQYDYLKYDKDIVSRYTVPFPLAYKTIKLTHESRAEDALKFFINKVKMQGLNSTEVMTNFMMRGDVLEGKFMTSDFMRRNNMLESELFQHIDKEAKFRVAGVDFASSQDYSAMVIADVYSDDTGTYNYKIRSVRVFNIDKQKIDQKFVSKEIASMCLSFKIDMIAVDASAQQQYHANSVVDEIGKLNINTLVVGYKFANNNKLNLMSYLEATLISQNCKLPKEEYIKTDKHYKILYNELITLKKEKTTKSNNLQYYAKLPDTDDCVMALAMSVYCVPYVENLIAKGKMIELESRRYFPRLNKFKLLSDSPTNTQPIRDSYISGLF